MVGVGTARSVIPGMGLQQQRSQGGGGQVKFYPYPKRRGGGRGKVLAMLKGLQNVSTVLKVGGRGGRGSKHVTLSLGGGTRTFSYFATLPPCAPDPHPRVYVQFLRGTTMT